MENFYKFVVLTFFLFSNAAVIADTVNINTADAAVLAAELDGVGEKTAAAIVTYREKHGPFTSVDELMYVKGIGERTLEANREKVIVE
ncbi:MAG: ComEA family DNA-binding protein [Gammaproteobacteria bacterium]|nr:ComEA family DNA-binding protein [Gammaproteobacteria bacterium]